MQVPLRDSISRACWGCSAPSEAVPPPRGHPAPWGREQAGIEPREGHPACPHHSWHSLPAPGKGSPAFPGRLVRG